MSPLGREKRNAARRRNRKDPTSKTYQSDRAYRQRPGVARRANSWWFESQYGITIDERDRLGEKQGGKCAICGCVPPKVAYHWLHVDHDHKTGKVRGLLCTACNKALGLLKDSAEICHLAGRYLERS